MTLIPKLLYLVPEIQYSSQGFSSKASGNDVNYKIDYINVPLLARVYIVKIFSLEAGPQFGFKISDSIDNATVETFDPSMAVGISFNLPLGLSINARYFKGFSDIIKDSGEKTEVVQLGAAFKI